MRLWMMSVGVEVCIMECGKLRELQGAPSTGERDGETVGD
jgi:hypothetical protein